MNLIYEYSDVLLITRLRGAEGNGALWESSVNVSMDVRISVDVRVGVNVRADKCAWHVYD